MVIETKKEVKVKDDPIIIKTEMQVNANPIGITPGSMVNIKIIIMDEYEIISTSHKEFTKDLVKVAPEGCVAKYSEKQEKTIVFYEGKSKLEIAKIVRDDLKKLPLN